MDAIIKEETLRTIDLAIQDMVVSVNIESSPDPKDLLSKLQTLFDGEDALKEHLAEKLIDMVKILSKASINKETQIMICMSIVNAAITGFLSERYSRDQIMDEKHKQISNLFSREYEGVDMFIKRRANSSGPSSLKEIAAKAAKRN